MAYDRPRTGDDADPAPAHVREGRVTVLHPPQPQPGGPPSASQKVTGPDFLPECLLAYKGCPPRPPFCIPYRWGRATRGLHSRGRRGWESGSSAGWTGRNGFRLKEERGSEQSRARRPCVPQAAPPVVAERPHTRGERRPRAPHLKGRASPLSGVGPLGMRREGRSEDRVGDVGPLRGGMGCFGAGWSG